MKKTVKAWAVVMKEKGTKYPLEVGTAYVSKYEASAEAIRQIERNNRALIKLIIKIVPCTITYTLPNIKSKKK